MDLDFCINTQSLLPVEAPRLTKLQSFGPLLNARDSFGWLHENKGFVGWTYTINPKVWTFLQPTRLIADRVKDLAEHNGKVYNSRIRVATCCHIKCYISKTSMLIGSFNLTAPTIEDLCVLVKDKKQIVHMRKTFDCHWKALAP